MPRYRLVIEYDGTPFVGWQSQANGHAVQDALRNAVLAFSGEDYIPRGAGRTDAGVHAEAQVAHLDLSREHADDTVRDALNAHLREEPVVILEATRVPDTFDARFSATGRHYRYDILNRRPPAALDLNRVWWASKPLDADAMDHAAKRLVGHYDFSTFRSANCQARSPMKTLDRLDVRRIGDRVHVYASSRSFLHNQVRSMVGSLRLVGEGRWTADDLTAALEARARARCGPVAPACGLYLTGVDYRPMEDSEPEDAAELLGEDEAE